ncbi:glycoside hydrolase family 97 catalytic domain-containing protein [Lactobacillus sp. CC-MHH1034]|uniref:glycoside hydrolase family 97 protein n=1 Tax=Agrilactobacillus fermenti TaxID=2586909 RepID=UPI001E3533CD|nr:glycoside hydrolase family 97 protein [Agrilactobacillus fermenti]MCD2256541.1 glycoside hydrolase family 97 catalytic domain-containing protein [Agrilactobacillus fermenti]
MILNLGLALLLMVIGYLMPQLVQAASADHWLISDTTKRSQAEVSLSADGQLSYQVWHAGKLIVEPSQLGLATNLGDLSTGLTLNATSHENIKQKYTLIAGPKKKHSFTANQLNLTFSKGALYLDLTVRAMKTGIAFRYGVRSNTADYTQVGINNEYTTFNTPTNSHYWYMPYNVSHEAPEQTAANWQDIQAAHLQYPLLYQAQNGIYNLISEAALVPNYVGSELQLGQQSDQFQLNLSQEQTDTIIAKLPMQTPWRFITSGSAKTITGTMMADDLGYKRKLKKTKWIKPGIAAWTWLNGDATNDLATYKRYIDLAAKMHWQYVILDEGWQPENTTSTTPKYQGYYSWTTALLKYAKQKKIGLIAWLDSNDLQDANYRQTLLAELTRMGFKGIKPDFFDSQNQATMQLYDNLNQLAAQHKLVIDYHGTNQPTGEQRTYPNILSKEAVFGAEQYVYHSDLTTAQHNVMISFMRGALGPVDYTPLLSFNNFPTTHPFTITQMLALPVLYQSGLQTMADKPQIYLKQPIKTLYKGLPASWDDSKTLEASVGQYVTIARRKRTTWYVAGITDPKRQAKVKLTFLKAGNYQAEIFQDDATGTKVQRKTKQVTRKTQLKLPLKEHGGFVVKLVKSE